MRDKLEIVSGGMLTIREAEKMSGFKKSFLYNRMATGDLPYVKIGGGRRIPRQALLEFLAAGLVIRRGVAGGD